MGSPLEMFSYLGLAMMVLGIFMTLFTRGRTYRVVTVVIIITMLMQTGSLLLFSGIIEEQVGFLWLGAGLVVGVLAGMKLKMESSQGKVTYKPSKAFTLGYLSLMLLSQILARFMTLAVPAVLMVSALALGLYLGMNMMVLSKSEKLRRTMKAAMLLILGLLMVDLSIQHGLGESTPAGKWELKVAPSTFGSGYEDYQTESWGDFSVAFDIIEKDGVFLGNPDTFQWSEVSISGKSIRMAFYENGRSDQPICTFEGVIDDTRRNMRGQFTIAEQDSNGAVSSNRWISGSFTGYKHTEYDSSTPAIDISNNVGDEGLNGDGIVDANEDSPNPGMNLGRLAFGRAVDPGAAGTAAGVSGSLSGIAALLSALSGLSPIGNAPIGNPNAAPGPAPNSPTPDIPKSAKKVGKSPVSPDPSNSQSVKRPAIGSKRADGTVFTKNHGWQNPDFPGLQSESLKQAINSLEGDILRHSQKGDTLRTEIAKDELKRNQRELKKWNEDALVMKKIQAGEKENLLQNQAGRWGNYADTLETAENVAKTVSFAADLALAVASSGASSTLTAAAGKIDKLIMAKEWFGVLAEGQSDVLRGKNIVNVIAEQGAKKVMTLAVGAEFGKGKEFYNIEGTSSKGLKALVSAGETAVGTMMTNTADDMGITKNFGNGSNTIVQEGLSTVKKAYTMLGGGDKQ